MSYLVLFGQVLGTRLGPGVEADDHGVGRHGQLNVRLGDAAGAGVDHPHPHVSGLQPVQGDHDRLHGALHIGLHDDVQLLDLPRLDLLEHVVQGDRRRRVSDYRLGGPVRCRRSRAIFSSSITTRNGSPAVGTHVQPQHLGRHGGITFRKRFPLSSKIAFTLP